MFIGLMLDWIKDDMREDPQQIVEKLLDNFPDLLHSEKKNSNKKDSNKDTKKKK